MRSLRRLTSMWRCIMMKGYKADADDSYSHYSMEKITLKFAARDSFNVLCRLVAVLTLDESGKHYTTGYEYRFEWVSKELSGMPEEEPSMLPKRVLAAFTKNVINKILSKDEIPNESGMMVLDGFSYKITITKGNTSKEYYADDANIETYPLLRFLARWSRNNIYS